MRGECGGLGGGFRRLKTRQLFQVYFWVVPNRESGLEVGEAVAVAKHEGEEFEGAPVAGDVAFRLGYGAEEPAEVEPVGPDGDVDLVAAEEGDGGADAVDGRAIVEVAFEVEAEALLRAAADGDDDVLGTE